MVSYAEKRHKELRQAFTVLLGRRGNNPVRNGDYIDNPRNILRQTLGISPQRATQLLKELQERKLVRCIYDGEKASRPICGLQLLSEQFPEAVPGAIPVRRARVRAKLINPRPPAVQNVPLVQKPPDAPPRPKEIAVTESETSPPPEDTQPHDIELPAQELLPSVLVLADVFNVIKENGGIVEFPGEDIIAEALKYGGIFEARAYLGAALPPEEIMALAKKLREVNFRVEICPPRKYEAPDTVDMTMEEFLRNWALPKPQIKTVFLVSADNDFRDAELYARRLGKTLVRWHPRNDKTPVSAAQSFSYTRRSLCVPEWHRLLCLDRGEAALAASHAMASSTERAFLKKFIVKLKQVCREPDTFAGIFEKIYREFPAEQTMRERCRAVLNEIRHCARMFMVIAPQKGQEGEPRLLRLNRNHSALILIKEMLHM